MQLKRDTGIVLRSQIYQERDRLVTFLTENHGKLAGIAKGAVHSRRFGGAFDLFTCVEFDFKDRDVAGATLVRIEGADIRRDFLPMRKKLENIGAAGYMADLCLRLTEEREPNRDLFLLLTHFYFLLERHTATPETILAFEVKLLDRLGYALDFEHCVSCEAEFFAVDELGPNMNLGGGTTAVTPAIDRGGFVCNHCKAGGEFSLASLAALAFLRECQIQKLSEARFGDTAPEAIQAARLAVQLMIRYHCPGLEQYDFASHDWSFTMSIPKEVPL